MIKSKIKIILVFIIGLMLTQCSTYTVKKDMSQKGELTKTPKWYVKYSREDKNWMYETASSVSPDLELSIKKSTLLAKAKLADRINGKMNNQSTIDKQESGINEGMSMTSQAEDTIINIVGDTLVRHYKVTKQEIFMTNHKSYRVYVMLEISKKDIDAIIDNINKRRLAVIDTNAINERAKEVVN